MLEVELITKGLANQPLSTADTANSTPSVLGIYKSYRLVGTNGYCVPYTFNAPVVLSAGSMKFILPSGVLT
jgi:hypothetical protein